MENQFSVVVDPTDCSDSHEVLAAKVNGHLRSVQIEPVSAGDLLSTRLSTGPATVASGLEKETARVLVSALSEQGIAAKLSRQLQREPPVSEDTPPVRQAQEMPSTFQGRPLAHTPSSTEPASDDTSSTDGAGVGWADVAPLALDDAVVAEEDPGESASEPDADGPHPDLGEGAIDVVAWEDVVAADKLDEQAPVKSPEPAEQPHETEGVLAEQNPELPQVELIRLMTGVGEASETEADHEVPGVWGLPSPGLARLFGVLAPGAGQMYLNRVEEARRYVTVGILIKPWWEAASKAFSSASAITVGRRRHESPARPIAASALVVSFWAVIVAAVVGITALYNTLAAPSVGETTTSQSSGGEGTSEGTASEQQNALAAEFAEREIDARATQLLLDANNACRIELYVRCARAACQARDLRPSWDQAARLCREATLAAGTQIQLPEPTDVSTTVPSLPGPDRSPRLDDGSGEGQVE